MKFIKINNNKRGIGSASVLIGVSILAIVAIAAASIWQFIWVPRTANQASEVQVAEKKEEVITIIDESIIKKFILTGKNFSFSENEIRVNVGDRVRIDFKSTEGFHDWVVDEFNAATDRVQSGKKTSVDFTASKAGTFEYYCSVGKHRELGMIGSLIVEE